MVCEIIIAAERHDSKRISHKRERVCSFHRVVRRNTVGISRGIVRHATGIVAAVDVSRQIPKMMDINFGSLGAGANEKCPSPRASKGELEGDR